MDAHSEYAPDYVSQCVEVLQSTGADNVGGPARIKATGYVQRAVGAAFQSRFSTGGARFHLPEYEGEVDTVHYGCWLKSTLLEIGLFDEELIRNQDDELNYRIRSRGGRLWQSPDIRSWYFPRSSLASLFSQYFQYGYWKVRVIQKHARSVALRHIVPVLFVLTLLVGWLPGVLYSPLLVIYAGFAIAYLAASIAFSVPAAQRRLAPASNSASRICRVSPQLRLGFRHRYVDFWATATVGIRKVDQAPPRSPSSADRPLSKPTQRNQQCLPQAWKLMPSYSVMKDARHWAGMIAIRC